MGRALAWLAAGLLAAGLVIGFMPVSSQGASCGSPYAPASAADTAPKSGCDEVRSIVRAPALALTVVGGALLLGVLARRGRGVDMAGHRTVLGRPVRRRSPGEVDERITMSPNVEPWRVLTDRDVEAIEESTRLYVAASNRVRRIQQLEADLRRRGERAIADEIAAALREPDGEEGESDSSSR